MQDLINSVKQLVLYQDRFWNGYSSWIKARHTEELGEHCLVILRRVICNIEESEDLRFLFQVTAIKERDYCGTIQLTI